MVSALNTGVAMTPPLFFEPSNGIVRQNTKNISQPRQ